MYRFFDQPATSEAIDLLARAPKLSVFVGAGASAEVGLPTWSMLIDTLADDVVADVAEEHRAGVKRFISDAGPLAAAERIERSLEGGLDGRLQSAIYQGVGGEGVDADPSTIAEQLVPGPLTIAAARLKQSDPSWVSLLTTNYDQLLVRALRDLDASAASYTNDTTKDEAVIHLHGVIGFEPVADGRNQIVLTERDFLAPDEGGWRRDVVDRALKNGSCVFVGASLTDLNLLTPLYNQKRGDEAPHVVVFARDPDVAPEVASKAEQIDRQRLGSLGVTALYVDNYGEVGQLLDEVRLRRADPDGYRPLPERLGSWEHRRVPELVPDDFEEYEHKQRTLSSALAELLGTIQSEFGLDDEILQLGLFAYGCDVDRGVDFARILAVSDRIMLDPRSSETLPADRHTKWTGVRAMIDCKPISNSYEHFSSRWRYFIAVPVVAPAPLDCCVGAVVLASNSSDSKLSLINTRVNAQLTTALQAAGEAVLLPPEPEPTDTPQE